MDFESEKLDQLVEKGNKIKCIVLDIFNYLTRS